MRHPRLHATTLILAFAALCTLGLRSTHAQQVLIFIDTNGPANSNWSNINNWAPQIVPETNNDIAQIRNGDPVVDANYTVKTVRTEFGTAGSSVSGPETLTIDVNSVPTAAAILNRSGPPQGGAVLSFDGNLTINNSGGGRTVARNENSSANTIRFGENSVLNLQTGIEFQGGAGGNIELNGQLAGPEGIFFGSNSNSIFGATADNAGYDGNLVFFGNATTVSDITGGTLVKTGSKVQVNGNNSSIEVNGPETFLGSIVLSAANSFTFDFDADQSSMDTIELSDGVLTLDVDPAVTELAFDDTSEIEWGAGSISIVGFKEDTIRFGTNASGLTTAQLAAIDGGIYSLSSQGYLTAMGGGPALPGDFNDDGAVDNGDLNLLLSNWGATSVPPEWINGFESPVDNSELNALLGNWGAQEGAAIPEPHALLIMGLCCLGSITRTKR